MGWTSAQTDAITTRGKTVLVSAAAGSGKTTTLTERIIRSITDEKDPADIGRFLVVTFTKSAAADLKNKISRELTKKLAENPGNKHISRQMIKLSSADICTIDSFYYKVVRENFDSLGLPSRIKMMDESEGKVLSATLMSDIIEEFYEKEESGGAFWRFMDCFTDSRGVNNMAVKTLTDLYEKLGGYPEGIEYLKRNAEILEEEAKKPFFDTRAGKIVYDVCERFFDHALKVYSDAIDLIKTDEKVYVKCGASYLYDHGHFKKTSEKIESKDYTGAKGLFDEYVKMLPSLPQNADEIFKKYKEHRKTLTERYESLGKNFFASDEAQCAKDALDTAAFCRTAYELLSEFEKRFSEEKKRRGVCDFADLKRFTIRLFIDEVGNPTELASEYSKRYDEIYIDEYQDTDLVQDRIFAAISNGHNRFMVGDIKQSIYRFRGANPSVFAGYKKNFPPFSGALGSDNCSIYMSENFRCDEPVIDFTNLICGHLFSHSSDSIGYTRDDDLVFNKEILPTERSMTAVSFDIVRSKTAQMLSDEERKKYEGGRDVEIRHVVSRIKELLFDPNQTCEDHGVLRHIKPRDIAVLVSGNKDADKFAAALTSAGIPTSVRTDTNYFDNPEVLLVFSLLNVIDNPQKDVFLAGVLRSPLFSFTFDELLRIRCLRDGKESLFDDVIYASEALGDGPLKEKILYFLSKLGLYREKAREMTVDKLLRFLYSDTMILSFAGLSSESDNSTSERRANLLLLYDYARRYEVSSYKGLYSFISYINGIIESGKEIEPPASEAKTNVVQVMTIHKSKGLEFPVCFVSALDKSFPNPSKNSTVLFDYESGIGVKFRDESGFASLSSVLFSALEEKIRQEDFEERIRVLYVAFTRARERLYLTAKIEKNCPTPDSLAFYSNPETIFANGSFLKLIVHVLSAENKKIDMNVIDPYRVPLINAEPDDKPPTDEGEGENEEAEENRIYEKISEVYAFEYPYSYLSKLPAKLSVSKLYPTVLDAAEDDGRSGEVTLAELPRFLIPKKDRASAADRGTATHTFMQFCDFEYAEKNGADAELERLCNMGLIPRESAELIRTDWLKTFFESDFYRLVSSAKNVWREKRFHIKLPASEFTADKELGALLDGEEIVVQGVIDLVFEDENGNIVLCDYKTDFLTDEELCDRSLAEKKLTERHRLQLTYYAEAVKQIFGRVPARICIYSLPLGDTIDVE